MDESNRRWKQAPYLMRATAYVGMGLKEEAFASLQQVCEQRSKRPSLLVSLKVEPLFDPLRGDARYQDLLRCAHLSR
jgi:hypothetical protein